MRIWLAMTSACAVSAQSRAAASAKHNILYIMADDLNADWKNDRLAWMPNLKKYFSEEGTEFEVGGELHEVTAVHQRGFSSWLTRACLCCVRRAESCSGAASVWPVALFDAPRALPTQHGLREQR